MQMLALRRVQCSTSTLTWRQTCSDKNHSENKRKIISENERKRQCGFFKFLVCSPSRAYQLMWEWVLLHLLTDGECQCQLLAGKQRMSCDKQIIVAMPPNIQQLQPRNMSIYTLNRTEFSGDASTVHVNHIACPLHDHSCNSPPQTKHRLRFYAIIFPSFFHIRHRHHNFISCH